MKNLFISLMIFVVLQFSALYQNCFAESFCSNDIDVKTEKGKIEAVLEKLSTAVQTKNMELYSEVFAHNKNIIIIGPDSKEMAFDWTTLAYIKNQQLKDLKNITISSKKQKIKIDSSRSAARYFVLSDLSFVSGDIPFQVTGVRETGVLEKENGKWVIVKV